MLGLFGSRQGTGASAWLAGEIEKLLKRRGFAPHDLDGAAVSSGPGSFTGLRVALATAKGLAWALDLRLLLVPTLDVLANGAAGKASPGELVAFIPYAGGEYHYARYRYSRRLSRYRRVGRYLCGGIEEITALATKGVLPVGLAGGDDLAGLCDAVAGTWCPTYPRAETLSRLAWERYQRRQWADLARAEPLYLRKSRAEERAGRRTRKRK